MTCTFINHLFALKHITNIASLRVWWRFQAPKINPEIKHSGHARHDRENRLHSYRVTLTTKGEELAALVVESGLLVEERVFLESLGGKITQKLVQSLFDWGKA